MMIVSQVPRDCDMWLNGFLSASETYPVCIAISDATIAGNALLHVNTEFCRVTGYSREEVLGRSCRFLQGPRTERQSVLTLQNTVTKGADSQVVIT